MTTQSRRTVLLVGTALALILALTATLLVATAAARFQQCGGETGDALVQCCAASMSTCYNSCGGNYGCQSGCNRVFQQCLGGGIPQTE